MSDKESHELSVDKVLDEGLGLTRFTEAVAGCALVVVLLPMGGGRGNRRSSSCSGLLIILMISAVATEACFHNDAAPVVKLSHPNANSLALFAEFVVLPCAELALLFVAGLLASSSSCCVV